MCARAGRGKVAGLELVQVDLDGAVGTLTINRPKALNALSAAVVSELHTALDALETLVPDSTLRCLIVTGAGDRAFVAGADIAGMVGMTPEAASVCVRARVCVCVRAPAAQSPQPAVISY